MTRREFTKAVVKQGYSVNHAQWIAGMVFPETLTERRRVGMVKARAARRRANPETVSAS
jgi:hypothetical protein